MLFKHRVSSNKCPGACLILILWGVTIIGGRRLKEGEIYFKVRETFHIKFQNFKNFSKLCKFLFPNNNK